MNRDNPYQSPTAFVERGPSVWRRASESLWVSIALHGLLGFASYYGFSAVLYYATGQFELWHSNVEWNGGLLVCVAFVGAAVLRRLIASWPRVAQCLIASAIAMIFSLVVSSMVCEGIDIAGERHQRSLTERAIWIRIMACLFLYLSVATLLVFQFATPRNQPNENPGRSHDP